MIRLSDQEVTARKRRNVFIALALVAFMVTVFLTTFLRMQHNSEMARQKYQAQTAAVATAPVSPETR